MPVAEAPVEGSAAVAVLAHVLSVGVTPAVVIEIRLGAAHVSVDAASLHADSDVVSPGSEPEAVAAGGAVVAIGAALALAIPVGEQRPAGADAGLTLGV